MGLFIAAWSVAGFIAGVVAMALWHRRHLATRRALSESRRQRRRDRAREAIVLARDNLAALDEDRALLWARRAVRLGPCNGEAHAVMAACLGAVDHYGQALVRHRRAEALGGGVWRVENALDAARACLLLREEADEAESQALWDEAHAWLRLAHDVDATEAWEVVGRSPWLAGLAPETWLQP